MSDWLNEGGRLGFGCLRLPMQGEEVDQKLFCQMVDLFLERGFRYFDTARPYLDGKSETALRDCLVARHRRDAFVLADKLSGACFETEDEIPAVFESQLEACGVDYFDVYLMHAQSAATFEKFKRCHAYEHALEFLKQGRICRFGISFHDRAEVLERILQEYPQIEVVQIQFNYVDFEDASVESRKCYEVCRKFGKPVIVMEPVKGGSLVRLPARAQQILDELHGGSNASYAIRFAAGFEGIEMVLSGMGDMDMLRDNLSSMRNFVPLSDAEHCAIRRVCEIFRAQNLIPCTACRYCVSQCPQHIAIPSLFACMNSEKQFEQSNGDYYYKLYTRDHGRASDCVKCGRCERICPQHLQIRALLEDVARMFEK